MAIKVATPHAGDAERQLQEFQREVRGWDTYCACLSPQCLGHVQCLACVMA